MSVCIEVVNAERYSDFERKLARQIFGLVAKPCSAPLGSTRLRSAQLDSAHSIQLQLGIVQLFLYISLPMAENQWFLDLAEQSRATFERDPSHATSRLVQKFKYWHDLLFEDDESLRKRPSATRSVRMRSRTLLRTVFGATGYEVLLVCTRATTPTNFSKVKGEGLIPQLQVWWNGVTHPQALKEAVAELKREFPDTFAILESQNLCKPQFLNTTDL